MPKINLTTATRKIVEKLLTYRKIKMQDDKMREDQVRNHRRTLSFFKFLLLFSADGIS